MLCAGVVHGDLSDFNVLMAADGPVVIDFPQSVDAAGNQGARRLLLRDVGNLERFLGRFVPGHRPRAFAEEMWNIYASSALTPDSRLTGRHRQSERRANTAAVLDLIGDANYDERKRRERHGQAMRGVPAAPPPKAHAHASHAPPHRPAPNRPAHSPPHAPPHAPPPAAAPAAPVHPQEAAGPLPRRRVVIQVDNESRGRPGSRRRR